MNLMDISFSKLRIYLRAIRVYKFEICVQGRCSLYYLFLSHATVLKSDKSISLTFLYATVTAGVIGLDFIIREN